jgi:hypothetical protein
MSDLRSAAEQLATRTRRAQGLTDRIEDPKVLAAVAGIVRGKS